MLIGTDSSIVYFQKKAQEILLDLLDFALQEQPEDNLMVAISRAWHNGSYSYFNQRCRIKV